MKTIPLLYGTRARALATGICLVALSADAVAQSADAMAIPVRKGSSSSQTETDSANLSSSAKTAETSLKTSSKTAETSAKAAESESSSRRTSAREVAATAPRPSVSSDAGASSRNIASNRSQYDFEADLAAVKNLRSASSGNNSSSEKVTADRDSGIDSDNEDRGEYETELSSREEPGSTPGRQTRPSNPGNQPPAPTIELAAMQAPSSLPSIATPPPPVQPAPNLYLPQPKEEGGLLSRLFRRNRSQPGNAATAPAVPAISADYFNSDYATRGSGALPPAIRGNGFNGTDLPIGGEDPYRLASLPSTFCPTDLVQLPVQLCHYGNQLYLRQEAANSLCSMISAAAQQGLNIKVVSAYRDIGHQTRLYNRAVARGGPDQKMVARPGKSEHNLGTTVDVTNSEEHTLKRSFGDTPEGRWLAANAASYGWKLTVMSGNGRRSHNDEPWHLRYLGSTINGSAPVSTIAQHQPQRNRRDVFGNIGRFLGLRD